MQRIALSGIVLSFAGIVVDGLGFMVLLGFAALSSLDMELNGTGCWTGLYLNSNASCIEPRAYVSAAYYLAIAGSALAVTGLWLTGIWKRRIIADGASSVILTGLGVLAAGFYSSSNLEFPSVMLATVGYFFGALGSSLLMIGLVKTSYPSR